jgi:hypothetical protein
MRRSAPVAGWGAADCKSRACPLRRPPLSGNLQLAKACRLARCPLSGPPAPLPPPLPLACRRGKHCARDFRGHGQGARKRSTSKASPSQDPFWVSELHRSSHFCGSDGRGSVVLISHYFYVFFLVLSLSLAFPSGPRRGALSAERPASRACLASRAWTSRTNDYVLTDLVSRRERKFSAPACVRARTPQWTDPRCAPPWDRVQVRKSILGRRKKRNEKRMLRDGLSHRPGPSSSEAVTVIPTPCHGSHCSSHGVDIVVRSTRLVSAGRHIAGSTRRGWRRLSCWREPARICSCLGNGGSIDVSASPLDGYRYSF